MYWNLSRLLVLSIFISSVTIVFVFKYQSMLLAYINDLSTLRNRITDTEVNRVSFLVIKQKYDLLKHNLFTRSKQQ